MQKAGLIFLGLLTVAALEAQDRKLAPELAIPNRTHDRTVDVIVQYKAGTFAGVHSRIGARGGNWKRHLDLIGGAVYSVPADAVDLIAADPDVVFVSPDRPVHATAFSGTADYSWMTALDVTSNTATLSWDGTGIGVAVIDSGITSGLDDLKDAEGHTRIVYQQSFIPNQGDANDHYGHGTHVAGIIGGNGSKSSGSKFDYTVRGIAPNVNLLDLRVLDQNGKSTDSIVIAAIEKAIQLKSQYNVRVIRLTSL